MFSNVNIYVYVAQSAKVTQTHSHSHLSFRSGKRSHWPIWTLDSFSLVIVRDSSERGSERERLVWDGYFLQTGQDINQTDVGDKGAKVLFCSLIQSKWLVSATLRLKASCWASSGRSYEPVWIVRCFSCCCIVVMLCGNFHAAIGSSSHLLQNPSERVLCLRV